MRYLAIVGLMAVLAVPVMGQGGPTSPTGQVTVNVTVSSFVEVEVIDPVLNWTTAGTTPWENDLAGKPVEQSRAKFKVLANTAYTLLVESSNGTWNSEVTEGTVSYEQAKFVNTSDPSKYIGGGLYLDATPESTAGEGFYYWNTEGGGTNFNYTCGHILTESRPAGVKVWGISATFSPAYDGNPDTIAAPGTYSTNAVITVAVG